MKREIVVTHNVLSARNCYIIVLCLLEKLYFFQNVRNKYYIYSSIIIISDATDIIPNCIIIC